jgi:hypothetical protein
MILYEHFAYGNNGCSLEHCLVQPIEQLIHEGSVEQMKKLRLQRETFWIKELRTLTPYGLNDRLESHNWRYRTRDDIVGLCFNPLPTKRWSRGSGLGNMINTQYFFKALQFSYDKLLNWRNLARIRINSVNETQLKELAWFFANQ